MKLKRWLKHSKSNEVSGHLKMQGFIPAMHPKSSIRPTLDDVKFALANGMVGQKKINGIRCQVHLDGGKIITYNRKGQRHAHKMSSSMQSLLSKNYMSKKGLVVLDGEWLVTANRLFLFDVLYYNGRTLEPICYRERHGLLARLNSTEVIVLPVIKTVQACMRVLNNNDETCEGLVFKRYEAFGFKDYNIVRCLKG